MAGHSQFKNIMHKKGAKDAKRARIFTRLTREIIVAARLSPDPVANPRLRTAVLAARAENMPKDKIEYAIKKGSGEITGENYEEIRYEGYGPGGIAIMLEVLTDNRNRAAADIRSIFSKHGGNMGETGSVGFMFDRKGVINYPSEKTSEEAMFEAALEAGAENCESDSQGHTITTSMESFIAARDALAEKFGDPASAKLQWIPQNTIPVAGEKATSLLKLIQALDDNDDVQEVTANFDITEAEMERLSA